MSTDASTVQVLATTKEELADKTQLLKEEKALTFKLTRDGEAYRFRIQVRALFSCGRQRRRLNPTMPLHVS